MVNNNRNSYAINAIHAHARSQQAQDEVTEAMKRKGYDIGFACRLTAGCDQPGYTLVGDYGPEDDKQINEIRSLLEENMMQTQKLVGSLSCFFGFIALIVTIFLIVTTNTDAHCSGTLFGRRRSEFPALTLDNVDGKDLRRRWNNHRLSSSSNGWGYGLGSSSSNSWSSHGSGWGSSSSSSSWKPSWSSSSGSSSSGSSSSSSNNDWTSSTLGSSLECEKGGVESWKYALFALPVVLWIITAVCFVSRSSHFETNEQLLTEYKNKTGVDLQIVEKGFSVVGHGGRGDCCSLGRALTGVIFKRAGTTTTATTTTTTQTTALETVAMPQSPPPAYDLPQPPAHVAIEVAEEGQAEGGEPKFWDCPQCQNCNDYARPTCLRCGHARPTPVA